MLNLRLKKIKGKLNEDSGEDRFKILIRPVKLSLIYRSAYSELVSLFVQGFSFPLINFIVIADNELKTACLPL